MKNGLDSRRSKGQVHIATMSSESANVEQFFFFLKNGLEEFKLEYRHVELKEDEMYT